MWKYAMDEKHATSLKFLAPRLHALENLGIQLCLVLLITHVTVVAQCSLKEKELENA